MKTKTFTVILLTLLILFTLLTVAHLCYAVYAYEHCSIIHFIAKELW